MIRSACQVYLIVSVLFTFHVDLTGGPNKVYLSGLSDSELTGFNHRTTVVGKSWYYTDYVPNPMS
jgi:hypothetical protein